MKVYIHIGATDEVTAINHYKEHYKHISHISLNKYGSHIVHVCSIALLLQCIYTDPTLVHI